MSKNEELVEKTNNAKNIYAMCRLYQERQEKGRELTDEEMLATRELIMHELAVYEETLISE